MKGAIHHTHSVYLVFNYIQWFGSVDCGGYSKNGCLILMPTKETIFGATPDCPCLEHEYQFTVVGITTAARRLAQCWLGNGGQSRA